MPALNKFKEDEAKLSNAIKDGWMLQVKVLIRLARQHLSAGQYEEALKLAEGFRARVTPKLEATIAAQSKVILAHGASNSKGTTNPLGGSLTKTIAITSRRLIVDYLETTLVSQVRTEVKAAIQRQVLKKADDSVFMGDEFDAAIERINAKVDMLAALHTSRLNAYGHLVLARIWGVTRYAINAKLDERGCEVCKFMHGKTFEVSGAKDRLDLVFHAQNPEDVKHLQPFVPNTIKSRAELETMSETDFVVKGWNVPPFHPNCRCTLIAEEDLPELQEPVKKEERLSEEVVAAEFDHLGVFSPDWFVTEWVNAFNATPESFISTLMGETIEQVQLMDFYVRVTSLDIVSKTLRGYPLEAVLMVEVPTRKLILETVTVREDFDVKVVLGGLASAAQKLGFNKIEIGVEGYSVWALLLSGFLPCFEDNERVFEVVGRKLKGMQDTLPPEMVEVATTILERKNPKGLVVICLLVGTSGGRRIPELLLEGLQFQAELNLQDEDSMDFFYEYIQKNI